VRWHKGDWFLYVTVITAIVVLIAQYFGHDQTTIDRILVRLGGALLGLTVYLVLIKLNPPPKP